MIGARHGAPLAVGYGEGEMFVGSDALALAPLTRRIAYLRGRRLGRRIARGRRRFRDVANRPVHARDRAHRRCPAPRVGKGELPPLHGEGAARAARP
jgi:glucosamine--fructose-6-phosphate aminotransferase (isomerizing)